MAKGFWAIGISATGAALLLGVGLGHFATTPQKPSQSAQPEWMEQRQDSLPDYSAVQEDTGPSVIRCTGCGPTLADRQMAADHGSWDPDGMILGSSDPVVQDYIASDDRGVALDEGPSSSARRLPPSGERFAAGEEVSPAAIAETVPIKVRPTLAPVATGQP